MGLYKIFSNGKMVGKSSVLFISALSPPITGVTVASQTILSYLKSKGCSVYVIDYARNTLASGSCCFNQFFYFFDQGLSICYIWR